MNFIDFKERFFDLGCFSTQQVYAWYPEFDRNNLLRWSRRGWLIRLRQGYYAFSEYLQKPDFALYIANRIYRPSYVSLHSALTLKNSDGDTATSVVSNNWTTVIVDLTSGVQSEVEGIPTMFISLACSEGQSFYLTNVKFM